MMSLYADDAVLTDTAHDNKVYTGKEQVRTYWKDVSGPFRPEHHWIGYTPAMRIKSHVTGNTGTLDFECLWMNVDDNTIGAHAFSSMTFARVFTSGLSLEQYLDQSGGGTGTGSLRRGHQQSLPSGARRRGNDSSRPRHYRVPQHSRTRLCRAGSQ
jgi:hypothetical protein